MSNNKEGRVEIIFIEADSNKETLTTMAIFQNSLSHRIFIHLYKKSPMHDCTYWWIPI